jgi:hypothetical protein
VFGVPDMQRDVRANACQVSLPLIGPVWRTHRGRPKTDRRQPGKLRTCVAFIRSSPRSA